MRVLFFILLFFAAPIVWAQESSAPSARFFSSMQDVPLVEGVVELADQAVTYDKPEGRIIESVAEIETGTIETVRKDYIEMLPQLGWARVSDNIFVRESEFLTLNFESEGGKKFVRVMIRPRN